jgi:DNA-binding phage protein
MMLTMTNSPERIQGPQKRRYVRKAPNPKITPDVIVAILDRVRAGQNKRAIARELGINHKGVYRVLWKYAPDLVKQRRGENASPQ